MLSRSEIATGAGRAIPVRPISAREAEVLEVARRGLTNAEIAEQLGVTVHTVKFHLASVYRKLGASNRTEAIVRWLASAPDRKGSD